MIDTNSMYGNVAEEKDTFMQMQQALKQKAEAKTKQTQPVKSADDIVIPEVDENYPANALQVMFDMQESLQNMLGKKRGTLTPDSKENLFVKSGMSIYHLGSVVTELFELDEQMQPFRID